jgi:hypothetical protein
MSHSLWLWVARQAPALVPMGTVVIDSDPSGW